MPLNMCEEERSGMAHQLDGNVPPNHWSMSDNLATRSTAATIIVVELVRLGDNREVIIRCTVR
jgi:hypothetical protein